MKIIAIIVAAGTGNRMKSDIPKQYLPLQNKTILHHCITTFKNHSQISNIICAINKDDLDLYQNTISDLKILEPVFGGTERQDSVRLALEKIQNLNPDLVLIHDSARPFVTKEVIDNLILKLDKNKAAIPTILVSDTIKKIENGVIINTIDRENLHLAQTPQGFNYQLILKLHRKYQNQKFTDDSSLCEKEKVIIGIVPGDINNFKITNKEDYDRARKFC